MTGFSSHSGGAAYTARLSTLLLKQVLAMVLPEGLSFAAALLLAAEHVRLSFLCSFFHASSSNCTSSSLS